MTVRFDLKAPDATFLSALSWNTGSIVSPTAAKAAGKDFQSKPIGAGPFKFVSWDKDVKTTMSRFDGYWGGAPNLDTLIWKPIVEEAARFNQLVSGDVDFIVSIDPQFVPAVQANPDEREAQIDTAGCDGVRRSPYAVRQRVIRSYASNSRGACPGSDSTCTSSAEDCRMSQRARPCAFS